MVAWRCTYKHPRFGQLLGLVNKVRTGDRESRRVGRLRPCSGRPNLPHGISKAGSRYSLLLIGLRNIFFVMGLDLAAYIVLNRLP